MLPESSKCIKIGFVPCPRLFFGNPPQIHFKGNTAQRLCGRCDREVGIHAAEKGIDVLYCIGLCCDYMADAAKKAGMKEVYYLETQEEFWEKGLPTLKAGDTILLKASRSREFEKTVAKLQGVN